LVAALPLVLPATALAAALVLLAELPELLLLRIRQHALHLAHGRLLVLAELLADRPRLLAQALELLPLLLGELRTLAALTALPLRPAALATPLLAARAEVGKAALLEERAQAVLQRAVAALQTLLDALQARHLVVAQVELLTARDQRLDAAATPLPCALLPAAAAALHLAALVRAVLRLRLLRAQQSGRGGQCQRSRHHTNLHRSVPLEPGGVQPLIRLRCL
jgi:hypothetical protein